MLVDRLKLFNMMSIHSDLSHIWKETGKRSPFLNPERPDLVFLMRFNTRNKEASHMFFNVPPEESEIESGDNLPDRNHFFEIAIAAKF